MKSPFAFEILLEECRLTRYDNHIERRLSSLRGQYSDSGAYQRLLDSGDPIIYEVYEISRPEVTGELRTGLSVVHAGRVGNEYFMTKGHFHAVVDTAETYYCVKGRGLLLMENAQGDWAIEELAPGRAVTWRRAGRTVPSIPATPRTWRRCSPARPTQGTITALSSVEASASGW